MTFESMQMANCGLRSKRARGRRAQGHELATLNKGHMAYMHMATRNSGRPGTQKTAVYRKTVASTWSLRRCSSQIQRSKGGSCLHEASKLRWWLLLNYLNKLLMESSDLLCTCTCRLNYDHGLGVVKHFGCSVCVPCSERPSQVSGGAFRLRSTS